MYSPLKVAERLSIAERKLGFRPEPHSVDEIDRFDQYLRRNGMLVLDEKTGLPTGTQSLSDFARRWMLNEQVLCLCDADYALTRYAYIKDEENVIRRFSFRVSQRIFYDIIRDLEDAGAAIEVLLLKARQLGALDPTTKVLTANLEWKSIDSLMIGEQIIGVDENTKGKGVGRKFRTATILKKWDVEKDAFKISMSNGKVLIATEDHLFLCKVRGGLSTVWRRVKHTKPRYAESDIRPGDQIRYAGGPWEMPDTFEDGWFSGLVDGEGSLRAKDNGGIELSVSQVAGKALDRASKYLTDRKIPFRIEVDNRKAGTSSKLGNQPVYKLVVNRMFSVLQLIGQLRPSRFIGRPVWEGKDMPSNGTNGMGESWATVISVESLGARRMVDIETTTKTFLAEGFITHNCSTVVELLIGHRIVFSYGINAIIGSADQAMTGRMSQMLFLFYDMLPVWLRPQWTRRVESDHGMLTFGAMASGVSFQHGAQKHGIGTGTTPTLYHLSEAALYEAVGGREKVVSLIEEGLWKAVHASPLVFGVIETTGRGDKGWFPDTWHYSKLHWPQRKSRMCPLFLPWFVGVDIYPTKTWIATRPIPPGWRPNHDTMAHVAKCELYVEAEPLLKKHLLAEQRRGSIAWNRPHPSGDWRMPREQQWFWECGHEEAKAKGTEGSWYQEMAADDIEALQRSGGEPVFGHATLADIDRRRTRRYRVFGIAGQSIESQHEPLTEYIDYQAERVPVRYVSPKSERYSWELIPMTFGGAGSSHPPLDESSPDAPMGLLIEYEPPTPNISYSLGVDTSEGKGQDSTAISVWALGWDQHPDRQVAEFASPYISHVEAFSFILAIAAYYKRYMALGTTRWREPYVSIEQVAAVGDVAQSQMARMGYSNFHRMVRYDKRDIGRLKRRTPNQGWFTWGWSRPILTGHFVHWVQNSWAEVASPWLLDEMRHFEIHRTAAGKERMEHEEDAHDDRIFAAAMAIFCPHDMDTLAQRSKKRSVTEDEMPELDLTPTPGGLLIPAAAMREKSIATLDEILYHSAQKRF